MRARLALVVLIAAAAPGALAEAAAGTCEGAPAPAAVEVHRRGWDTCELCGGSDRLGVLLDIGDVRKMDADGSRKVLEAVRNYGVVVLKGQNLTRGEQVAFSAALGEVVVLPGSFEGQDPEPGFPEIQRVTNFWANGTWKGTGKTFGAYWHQDGQFWPRTHRNLISMLYSSAAPAKGGQTGFADLRRALHSLSPPLRERAREASIHASVRDIPDFIRYGSKHELDLFDDVTHPMIDSMPHSTHTSVDSALAASDATLYIGSPQMRTTMDGEGGQGLELLRLLFAHATSPSFTYYHHWTPGDIVLWDNVQTLHHAFPYNNDGVARRELFRTQVRRAPTAEHTALVSDGASGKPRWLGEDGLPVWVTDGSLE
jgi:taurine dioxygenase